MCVSGCFKPKHTSRIQNQTTHPIIQTKRIISNFPRLSCSVSIGPVNRNWGHKPLVYHPCTVTQFPINRAQICCHMVAHRRGDEIQRLDVPLMVISYVRLSEQCGAQCCHDHINVVIRTNVARRRDLLSDAWPGEWRVTWWVARWSTTHCCAQNYGRSWNGRIFVTCSDENTFSHHSALQWHDGDESTTSSHAVRRTSPPCHCCLPAFEGR